MTRKATVMHYLLPEVRDGVQSYALYRQERGEPVRLLAHGSDARGLLRQLHELMRAHEQYPYCDWTEM